ncbi:MAG: methyltransferase domain-containing protein [Firmicutes bacterium]|nr:methyltransferase domain-containing protein [Bacillota bacterium]
MKKPLLFAQDLVRDAVKAGEIVVDATCGNGHDTVFLAQCVGAEGHVYAFDIQEEAIESTKKRIKSAGVQERVTLNHANHANREAWPQTQLAAVMFNLGYLPGGNHAIITRAETTVSALQIAVNSLKKNGIITLVVYTGHPGGADEYHAVRNFCAALSRQNFAVLEYQFINQLNQPPLLLAVKRL